MKNFILGFIVGAVFFGAVWVYADIGVLYNSRNVEIGTTANPLYVQGI